MPLRSDSRTIVITGASSGIGRALALATARDGFRVLLVARREDRLNEAAAEIRARGDICETLVADVIAPDAPARIVEAALRAFGRIDVVVNNAGAGALGLLLEIDDAEIEAQWQLHVAAPLRIARAALPHVRATHGQYVFIGSGLARVPIPNYGAYAAAKAAVRAVSIQLRRELKNERIAVTYVDPGLVATEFHQAMGTLRSNEVPAADPRRVAHAILRGIVRRSPSVAGVPWQTAGTIIGEWSSTLADPTLIKMAPSPVAKASAATSIDTSGAPQSPDNTSGDQGLVILSVATKGSVVEGRHNLETALEPVARRMERVKLTQQFIEATLTPGATVELNELAMRWAGMPNKNERAAMREVLDALAAAGYLQPSGDETWTVLRAAD